MPEFGDRDVYLDVTVNQWIGIANSALDAARWGEYLAVGIELFVAHHLVLMQQAQRTAAGGGIPGLSSGIVSSKSVGPASVSYDTNLGSMGEAAGLWNRTIYGQEFIRLAWMAGAGGVQVSGCLPGGPGTAWGSSSIWGR